jgi:nucleoid-associated protein YgaU
MVITVNVTRRVLLAAASALDLLAVAALRPDAALLSHLGHLGPWMSRAGCDRVLAQLAGAALWVAACWTALGLLAAFGAVLPGLPGRISARICRAVLPRAARRLVAGTAGLGVLMAPAAALAASPGHSPVATSAAGRHVPSGPLPAPTWPTSPSSERPVHHRPTTRSAETARVRPGDCLWRLAARHLPARAPDAEVAAYWPRWYAANRGVIGADPDLLLPGEVLHVPPPPAKRSITTGPR